MKYAYILWCLRFFARALLGYGAAKEKYGLFMALCLKKALTNGDSVRPSVNFKNIKGWERW